LVLGKVDGRDDADVLLLVENFAVLDVGIDGFFKIGEAAW
jgi:hypothetical protein